MLPPLNQPYDKVQHPTGELVDDPQDLLHLRDADLLFT